MAASPQSGAGGEVVETFGRIAAAPTGEQRTKDLQALLELVKKGEIRDYSFDAAFYEALFDLLNTAFSWRGKDAQGDVHLAEQVFLGITKVPEFEAKAVEHLVEGHVLRALHSRSDGSSQQEEWPMLRDLYIFFYGHFPAKRTELRALIGRSLKSSGSFCHKSAPTSALLEALVPVIHGFQTPLTAVHRSLLFDILMPLHKTNDWQQWDRQSPMIGMYHKELVRCVMLILEKQPALAPQCIEALCKYFPTWKEANTPKEVLLIYEISQILKRMQKDEFLQVLPNLLQHLCRLLGSHNAQTVQSVLQFWKDEHVAGLFDAYPAKVIPVLLPSLVRGGEVFWNPTANKMMTVVLERLEKSDPEVFKQAAEDMWGPGRQVPAFLANRRESARLAAEARAEKAEENAKAAKSGGGAPPAPNVSSLKFCLGGWKPPGAAGGGSGGKPPVTATGVAPWAMNAGGAGGGGGGAQPPLTATGVAPWAFSGGAGGAPRKRGPLSAMQGGPGGLPSLGEQQPTNISTLPDRNSFGANGTAGAGAGGVGAGAGAGGGAGAGTFWEEDEEEDEGEKSGLDRLRDYIKLLLPAAGAGGAAVDDQYWEAALTAETPTLLPSLKFHQLVFGPEDIAAGAFSVVRYARTIQKETTQSKWPEYAVKVINTKTIQEHGYEASVNREICVLRMLSHPGIARMVSSFRYRDGAYLVLEYASKGDLHTILVQQGALPEATVRFFVGEVVAALVAIHHSGFVYSDLKPENIVITATNHAKLTDFGGCRPLTDEARSRTRQSLLNRLRDGDWRAKDAPDGDGADVPEEEAIAAADDNRFEGTTMYLPPEVVRGAAPTLAADAWALGCLTYMLLMGKPPIWAESELEEDLKHRIVSFKFGNGDANVQEAPEVARGLIGRLLEPDLSKRLSVEGAASDSFFDGEDVFRLYSKPRGPNVEAGKRKGPKPEEGDARWQKRQFSKIWSCIPSEQDYRMPEMPSNVPLGGGVAASVSADFSETEAERGEPFMDEALADNSCIARPSRIESL